MKILSILGRSGAGKGTQVKFLAQKSGFEIINTGKMLRQRAKKNDIIGRKIENSGTLIPTPIVFSLWLPRLIEIYESTPKGVIFDGNPRKLYEAYMLEELFEVFKWNDFRACHIHISEKEAHRRLSKRGREDDTKEGIEKRLDWFSKEVQPVIKYYKEKGVLIEINGENSVKEVSRELEEKLADFLL